MSDGDKAVQMALNILGFLFILLGLALDGGSAMAVLGLAVVMFVAALGVAIAASHGSAPTNATARATRPR